MERAGGHCDRSAVPLQEDTLHQEERQRKERESITSLPKPTRGGAAYVQQTFGKYHADQRCLYCKTLKNGIERSANIGHMRDVLHLSAKSDLA